MFSILIKAINSLDKKIASMMGPVESSENNLQKTENRKEDAIPLVYNHNLIKDPKSADLKDVKKLTFITYNVWFENHNFVERNIELRNIFKKYK